MKSNPHKLGLEILAALGTGFDCASQVATVTIAVN